MVALLLLGVGIASIASGIHFSLRASAASDAAASAIASARLELEWLYAKGFTDPALAVGTRSLARAGYNTRHIVTQPTPTTKQIEVRVDYRGYSGETRQAVLITLVSSAMR